MFGCAQAPEDEDKITISIEQPPAAPSITSYHITTQGQQQGPYTIDEIKALISKAQLSSTEYYWTTGMAEWAPLAQLLGYNQTPASPSYLPQPPLYYQAAQIQVPTPPTPSPYQNAALLAPPVYQTTQPVPLYQPVQTQQITPILPPHQAIYPENSRQNLFQTPQTCPPTYMGQAIFLTFCCCMPLGIVSIIYASQVQAKYYSGDYLGAQSASDMAKGFFIAGIILGLVGGFIYLIGAAANS